MQTAPKLKKESALFLVYYVIGTTIIINVSYILTIKFNIQQNNFGAYLNKDKRSLLFFNQHDEILAMRSTVD